MIVPKSLNHSNITDNEIKNYYSLRPVKDTDDEYDFNKQINKIIIEYMKTQSFSSDQAKRNFKSRLKKFIVDDNSQRGKVYDSFINWRMAKIQQYKSKVRDLRIEESKTADVLDYEQIIKDLRTELKQAKTECEIYKKEIIELKKDKHSEPLVKPIIKEVVKEVVKPIIKEVVKENIYLKYDSDEEREAQYKNKILAKENELIEKFEYKYKFNKSTIDLLQSEFLVFMDFESEKLEETIEEFDEEILYDLAIDDFKDKLLGLASDE